MEYCNIAKVTPYVMPWRHDTFAGAEAIHHCLDNTKKAFGLQTNALKKNRR